MRSNIAGFSLCGIAIVLKDFVQKLLAGLLNLALEIRGRGTLSGERFQLLGRGFRYRSGFRLLSVTHSIQIALRNR